MDDATFHEWQVKRASRLLQKATNVKYTACRRYIEEVFKDEKTVAVRHYHIFTLYGEPYIADGEKIFRLRCVTCGGNTFAFAVKTSHVVED